MRHHDAPSTPAARFAEEQSWKASMNRNRVSLGSLIGVALVVLGAMFLLENSGLAGPDTRIVATYWPAFLIAVGLWGLLAGGFRSRFFPLVILAVGAAFLLSNLDLVDWTGRLIWPAVLIVVGLALLSRRRFPPRRSWRSSRNSRVSAEVIESGSGAGQEETQGRERGREFRASYIFSGGKERVTSPEFSGGEISAVFGGVELDLRDAGLAHGKAVLEATVVFGGLELRVPREWRVAFETTTLFGGTEVERSQPSPSEATGELTITGTVVFGGIEVKD